MASKLKSYVASRTFLVERQTTFRAASLIEAAQKLSEMTKMSDFDTDADYTDTGETNLFIDYDSSIQRRI